MADKSLWNISCFFVVASLALFAAGYFCRRYADKLEPFKGIASAKVVDLVIKESLNGIPNGTYQNFYYPIIQYLAEGKLYEVMYPHGSYPSRFKINQTLRLNYSLEDPMAYHLTEKSPWKTAAAALNAAAGIFLAVGCITFLIFALRG